MKWFVLIAIIGLTVLYVAFAGFGLVMSAFCFDSGQTGAAWQCFSGINAAVIGPSVLCVIGGLVLFFFRRYKMALAVAAVPALVALIGYFALLVVTLTYRPSL